MKTTPLFNVGVICDKHTKERLANWQAANKDTAIKAGDFVKRAFTDNGITENMWVHIKGIVNKNEFVGVLDNDPARITSIKCGDPVLVRREEICEHVK